MHTEFDESYKSCVLLKSFVDRIVWFWKSTKIDFISTSTSRFNYLWPCHQKLIRTIKKHSNAMRCRCVKLFDKYSVHSENKNIFINIDEWMNIYCESKAQQFFPRCSKPVCVFSLSLFCCCRYFCCCVSKIISILVWFYSSFVFGTAGQLITCSYICNVNIFFAAIFLSLWIL